MTTRIMWFRRDLRLHDNTALAKAVEHTKEGERVLLLFHIHPALNEAFTIRHDYFFQTLQSLMNQEAPLHFVEGDWEERFDQLFNEYEVSHLYFNVDQSGFGWERDQQVARFAKERDVRVMAYQDHHLHGAKEIRKKDGEPYKVFTPYFKQWKQQPKPHIHKLDRDKWEAALVDDRKAFKEGEKSIQKLLDKTKADFKGEVGEKAAFQTLEQFVDGPIYDYGQDRDMPAIEGTSRLSKYLRTGAISIRTVYQYVMEEVDFRKKTDGVETFISELAWRDFYNMVYHTNPDMGDVEINEKYQGIPWNQDEELLMAWKEGRTGYPLIDAGMRQLNETGWMHNRLRMATASFLTKDLLIDWRIGERYFRDRLIDYDPASNIGGWQWAASTGTDAVPYFRVFNPTTQAERFDPHGRFIKEWVPELEHVPKKYIHDPSRMSEEEQKQAGCIIGQDYPAQVVDHKTMRKRAIELFEDHGS